MRRCKIKKIYQQLDLSLTLPNLNFISTCLPTRLTVQQCERRF